MTFRPPVELKKQLQEKAKEIGIPLNSLLILICRTYLQQDKSQEES